MVNNLLGSNRSRSPSPTVTLSTTKRAASPSYSDNNRATPIRIINRYTSGAPGSATAVTAPMEALQRENEDLRRQNADLLFRITELQRTNEIQLKKMDNQATQMLDLQYSINNLTKDLSAMNHNYQQLLSQASENRGTLASKHAPPTTPTTAPARPDAMELFENTAAAELVGDKNNARRNQKNQKDQHQRDMTEQTPSPVHPRPWNAKHIPQTTITYASVTKKTVAPTGRPKQSYSAIAEKLVSNKPTANAEAAKSALAFFHQKRVPHKSSTEQRLGLRRIYDNGIPRTSYKDLKSRLFA
ncbi:hypothetical protein K450DRAFT_262410 [Umbelopsis ramanniana AG]|uniref:Uncharacterized protein n=1 Tax=Umbelopsis ramanniana AG TaxID=1314678 RepID=A0AAD5H7X4_UMBRA|nr:uncharacterized protein K450DRAFT_262410 [Umbelopsis ramanniana AG]KAI8575282.1 hypothetical protein K450DRAFT_262410 [Umbelopsis ramanniana AG]